jgi:hypothetical protein
MGYSRFYRFSASADAGPLKRSTSEHSLDQARAETYRSPERSLAREKVLEAFSAQPQTPTKLYEGLFPSGTIIKAPSPGDIRGPAERLKSHSASRPRTIQPLSPRDDLLKMYEADSTPLNHAAHDVTGMHVNPPTEVTEEDRIDDRKRNVIHDDCATETGRIALERCSK